MLYLDAAAIVKLVHSEPESETLRAWLADRAETGWISSVLVEVEAFRALARHSPGAISRLPPVLDLIEMVEINQAIRTAAQTVAPTTVRSLDAIHLATALRLGEQLTSFVTYDKRLADAAQGAGLRVDMPAR
jgi:uncharacterized protein